ncbi:RNA chaperone Hfq (plasmid) [Caldicellulosiruptor acetigenus I77R1B]|uniref:RNA-binding protein Hfq n=1 Tax=Caldicellulosiruptor acetigenus (strain ATCC 700853 / DSM 12137 / I77R1B) TaxID=632335 RepID=E4SAZ2_CALA7|nr:RNA chaperone Hfq [Caldicellulosiruptor acetigenus I77R1B]
MKDPAFQDVFLNNLRKGKVHVTVYLFNGAQLKGVIKAFDTYTIVLQTSDKKQLLIYKHGITTIVPSQTVEIIKDFEEQVPQGEAPEGEAENKAIGPTSATIRKVKLEDIKISQALLNTPPRREKVEKFKQQYLQTGRFEKYIKVKENTMMLVDGYAKYVAAKELNLKEVEVEIVK